MTTPTTFTKRTNSPFRADFVGSFLRPAELANARNLHRKGIIDDLKLKQVEDKCSWQVGFFMFGIVNFFKIFLFDGLFALNKPLLWRHL